MSKRRENCLKKLLDTDLDGVLFATGANLQYLSETTTYVWQRSSMNNCQGQSSAKLLPEVCIYMNRAGNVTIFSIPRFKDCFKDPVVVSYMDQMADSMAPYIQGKKIGIGYDCQEWLKETLQEVDCNITTEDAESLFYDLRSQKDETEIELMRKIAKFTDEAILYVVSQLKEGMTQYDVEQMVMQYGIDHGIQDFSFSPTAGFKTRCTFKPEENFEFPRTSVLVPGTAIAFDIGFVNEGYCSDWGRTVYFGTAPKEVKEGYQALHQAQVEMVKQIVPNKTNVNELFDMIQSKVKELGYEDVLRHKELGMLGHQIGIDCHEHPWISRQNDAILKPGMIFCSEPKMMFENECFMRIEDMILVTETGAEILTNFPRDLFEVK